MFAESVTRFHYFLFKSFNNNNLLKRIPISKTTWRRRSARCSVWLVRIFMAVTSTTWGYCRIWTKRLHHPRVIKIHWESSTVNQRHLQARKTQRDTFHKRPIGYLTHLKSLTIIVSSKKYKIIEIENKFQPKILNLPQNFVWKKAKQF